MANATGLAGQRANSLPDLGTPPKTPVNHDAAASLKVWLPKLDKRSYVYGVGFETVRRNEVISNLERFRSEGDLPRLWAAVRRAQLDVALCETATVIAMENVLKRGNKYKLICENVGRRVAKTTLTVKDVTVLERAKAEIEGLKLGPKVWQDPRYPLLHTVVLVFPHLETLRQLAQEHRAGCERFCSAWLDMMGSGKLSTAPDLEVATARWLLAFPDAALHLGEMVGESMKQEYWQIVESIEGSDAAGASGPDGLSSKDARLAEVLVLAGSLMPEKLEPIDISKVENDTQEKVEEPPKVVVPAPSKPYLSAHGVSLRVEWTVPNIRENPITLSAVRVRAVGEKNWLVFDMRQSKLVSGSRFTPVPMPTCSILISGLQPGVKYEAKVAVKNSGPNTRWSGGSPVSDPLLLEAGWDRSWDALLLKEKKAAMLLGVDEMGCAWNGTFFPPDMQGVPWKKLPDNRRKALSVLGVVEERWESLTQAGPRESDSVPADSILKTEGVKLWDTVEVDDRVASETAVESKAPDDLSLSQRPGDTTEATEASEAVATNASLEQVTDAPPKMQDVNPVQATHATAVTADGDIGKPVQYGSGDYSEDAFEAESKPAEVNVAKTEDTLASQEVAEYEDDAFEDDVETAQPTASKYEDDEEFEASRSASKVSSQEQLESAKE